MSGLYVASNVLLQAMVNKGKMELQLETHLPHLAPFYIPKHVYHGSSYGTIAKGTKLSYVG
jgi:hypothetical protein